MSDEYRRRSLVTPCSEERMKEDRKIRRKYNRRDDER